VKLDDAQDGDKICTGVMISPVAAIDDLAGAAGEIDEQLLAGDMRWRISRLQPARHKPGTWSQ